MFQELRDKQKQEEKMQEELEGLKESLKADQQNLEEVTNDRDRLRSLCSQKDKALQVKVFTSWNDSDIICLTLSLLFTCLTDDDIY